MPFAEANGQRLYYEVHGEGEPLLLVMGLSADHLAWALQIPAFSATCRTIVFDNRDVGQSSYADGPYEIADMAQDALGLADALELESFHLLGISLGGTIAQEMALTAPERIRTLTLATTYSWGGAWGRERARVWAEMVERLPHELHVDNLLLLTLSQPFYENADMVALVRNATLANPHRQRPDGFARQVRAAGAHEARDRLPGLTMPVHVIGAEHDILIPVWASREIAELVPGAKLTVIERAPHAVNIDGADRFNAAVLDFIAAHTPASQGSGRATPGASEVPAPDLVARPDP